MSGLRTVFWKEGREFLFPRGRPSWTLLGAIAMGILAGVVLPTLTGLFLPLDYRATFAPRALDLQLSMMFVIGIFGLAALTPESVAGERERHTLETLLASPLTGREIVLGKTLALTAYGSAVAWAVGAAGIASVSVLYGPGRVDIPDAGFLALLAFEVALMMFLLACIGTIVSLLVPTVRMGQQIIVPIATLMIFPIMLSGYIEALPGAAGLVGFVDRVGDTVAMAVAIGATSLLCAAAFLVAQGLFRRGRLMH